MEMAACASIAGKEHSALHTFVVDLVEGAENATRT